MSRIGKQPIAVPAGVSVKIQGREVCVFGTQGRASWTFPETAKVVVDESSKQITVERMDDSKQSRANHGLTRALIANMVKGVTEGFSKRLEIYGTGYNCKVQGRKLLLNVGFSGRGHGRSAQFEFPIPEGVEVVIEKEAARGDTEPAQLVIKGSDRQLVGEFAAEIREIRITEPYKGKGIRYQGEVIKRKQGKTLTGGA